jgi:histidinol-phosphate aminotransferase
MIMDKNIYELVRKNILQLTPYSTARDEYKEQTGIFLDANENPYDNGYNRYPNQIVKKNLKHKIGKIRGISSEKIFIGNGSDEAIDLCYRIFCEPRIDNVVAISPSYGMYKVAAQINNIEFREVQLNEDFSLPVEKLLSVVDANTKLMFLCSPNNPTANSFLRNKMIDLIKKFKGIVIVDEAYIDFADQCTLLPELDIYQNLIILQTFSKAWGLAGLRIEIALASPEIIKLFVQVKYPYNISVPALNIALNRLEVDVSVYVAEIKSERERVISELEKCECIKKVFPSEANFVLVSTYFPQGLYGELLKKEIIVRDRSKVLGCEGTLRITIGTPSENDLMLETVKKYNKNE